MKKLLTVSLVAMMAVSAARADIASTDYVTDRTGDVSTLTTTSKVLTGAVNELANTVSGVKTTADAAATKAALDALSSTVSGIDTAYKAADETLTQNVSKNTQDIAAINNETTGILAQAKAYAKEQADNASGSASGVASDLAEFEATVAGTYATKTALTEGLGTKQDTIADLETIRSGAAAGATAVQPAAINDMQVKSNIHTTGKLEGEALNTKYPSVGYVDTKVASINTDLAGIEGRLTTEESATTTMKGQLATINDSLAAGGATANAIAAAKKAADDAQDDLDAYKTSNDAALEGKQANLTEAQLAAVDSGITGDKVSTYDGYSELITAAQNKANANATSIGEMDLAEVKSDGMAIVSISEENGKVTAATGTIKNAGIAADAEIAQSKIAGLTTDLAAKLDKSALTNASKAGTGETGTADGVYTLTMKVAGGVQTYVWEKIAR